MPSHEEISDDTGCPHFSKMCTIFSSDVQFYRPSYTIRSTPILTDCRSFDRGLRSKFREIELRNHRVLASFSSNYLHFSRNGCPPSCEICAGGSGIDIGMRMTGILPSKKSRRGKKGEKWTRANSAQSCQFLDLVSRPIHLH